MHGSVSASLATTCLSPRWLGFRSNLIHPSYRKLQSQSLAVEKQTSYIVDQDFPNLVMRIERETLHHIGRASANRSLSQGRAVRAGSRCISDAELVRRISVSIRPDDLVRLAATTLDEPIDSIADRNDGEAGASDGAGRATDVAVVVNVAFNDAGTRHSQSRGRK
jgi:hypothetical protein